MAQLYDVKNKRSQVVARILIFTVGSKPAQHRVGLILQSDFSKYEHVAHKPKTSDEDVISDLMAKFALSRSEFNCEKVDRQT